MGLDQVVETALEKALEEGNKRKLRVLFEIKVRIKSAKAQPGFDKSKVKDLIDEIIREKKSIIKEMSGTGNSKLIIDQALDVVTITNLLKGDML